MSKEILDCQPDLRHAARLVLTQRGEHREATVAYAAEILRTLDEVERLIATRVRVEA